MSKWILCLVVLGVLSPIAHAAGVVSTCNEASLNAALVGGEAVTFSCSGTITLTATLTIAADTTISGTGQAVTLSGNNLVRIVQIPFRGVAFLRGRFLGETH